MELPMVKPSENVEERMLTRIALVAEEATCIHDDAGAGAHWAHARGLRPQSRCRTGLHEHSGSHLFLFRFLGVVKFSVSASALRISSGDKPLRSRRVLLNTLHQI